VAEPPSELQLGERSQLTSMPDHAAAQSAAKADPVKVLVERLDLDT